MYSLLQIVFSMFLKFSAVIISWIKGDPYFLLKGGKMRNLSHFLWKMRGNKYYNAKDRYFKQAMLLCCSYGCNLQSLTSFHLICKDYHFI